MGCASSKQRVCRKCQEPYSRVRGSYSVHAYHPPQKDGDSFHLVALTSSTLGSLNLDLLDQNYPIKKEEEPKDDDNHWVKSRKEDFEMGVIEAKTWSTMMDEKIPKVVPRTPIRTPPSEPETINAWELMEGLEDSSPLLLKPANHHIRSFSFHVRSNQFQSFVDDQSTPRVLDDGEARPTIKPIWLDIADISSDSNSNSNDTSIVSELDLQVISKFRKSLEELPQVNPFHLEPLINEKQQQQALDGKDRPLIEHVKEINESAPRGKERLIVYFTSLRGVRKTYEDCCYVRIILKGLGVKLDERDVSMHSGFKEELKELLGENNGGALPKVFIGTKKFLGGPEEIRRMNEDGQLEKAVEGCESVEDGDGGGSGNGGVCEACGDARFVPCETCCGSCKIYYEGDYDEEYEDAEYGFQRCPDCNENGLIRCPICCD